MAYKFLSTILGIDANFTGKSSIGTLIASTDYSDSLLSLSKSNGYTTQEIRGVNQSTLVLTSGVTANSTTPAIELFNSYNFGIKFIGGTTGGFSNYPMYYYAGDGAGTGDYTMFQVGGAERMRIVGTNVLIGTTTNAGFRLDVNGTTRIVGVATFNNNITQTSGSATFANGIILDSTRRIFGGNTITYQSNDAASQHYFKNDISSGLSGTLVTIGNGSGTFGTTSASNFLNISGRLATASGTNNLTSILLNHTVENTGTYTGTIRGIYYNPSSIVGTGFTHRAIETTTGDVIFNSTSGSVGIGTTSPAYKLQVAGDIGFTAGANRYIRLANPAASGSANHIIIQGASANTSGTGGNIYLYEGSGAGGPGPGSIYIGATNGWTTAYVTGRLTVSNSGPNTDTAFQVNAGGQNGLTINWDNVTPYMGYGLVSGRQSRFYNSSSYTFDNNLIIGSNTDAGYKLDVNGSARVANTLTVNGTGTNIAIQFVAGRIDADGTYVRIKSAGNYDMINIAQNFVGINATTATASAVLQVDSTTRGFLPPRMTATQRGAISTPAVGLVVYQTDGVEGLYVNTSGGWKALTMV